ncbi:hypothetical protein [Aquipuribacter sp. SD81]|uniref:hypothetical protein n=1 Tax=Aquipuribacter sp. SD81 TaxID=3127703 RepID=UPI00301A6E0F
MTATVLGFPYLPFAVLGAVVGCPAGLVGGAVAAAVLGVVWRIAGRDWTRVRPSLPVGLVLAAAVLATLWWWEPVVALPVAVSAGALAGWRAERALRRLRAAVSAG